jgi:hypothetical protein
VTDYTAPPTRADLLAYMGAGYADPGQRLDHALAAAIATQAARCAVDPYGPDLFTACLRRAAAILTAANAPLGITDLGDYGGPSGFVPRYDAITDALEADHLRSRFA